MPQQDEFSLKALADTLVVDLEAGVNHVATTIEYTKAPEWIILHRFYGDDWIGVPLEIVGLDDPTLSSGSFQTLPLKPGQIYEACIVPPDFDPDPDTPVHELIVRYDVDDRGPPAHVSVVALKKRPELRDFYSDGNSRPYGTYHERDVIATIDVFARLSISRSPWVDTADGILVLPGAEHVVAEGPKQTFHFRVKDLLPGTQYYELLLLTDEFGNWQFLTDDITMKRRKVEAEVTELYIVWDSDDHSSGEASFSFYLHTGNPPLAKSNVIEYAHGELESGEFALPLPTGTCVLGPHAVTPDTKRVFFYVYSREDDTGSVPADADDFAWDSKELHVPVGPGENVPDGTDGMWVRWTYGDTSDMDGWNFDINFKYSITYQ
jgi:hypothetical protein